jgi:hypothetical protein
MIYLHNIQCPEDDAFAEKELEPLTSSHICKNLLFNSTVFKALKCSGKNASIFSSMSSFELIVVDSIQIV